MLGLKILTRPVFMEPGTLPMGSLRLMDLADIDLACITSMERFRKTGDFSDFSAPGIVEKYFQGPYGEKTGMGRCDYSKK